MAQNQNPEVLLTKLEDMISLVDNVRLGMRAVLETVSTYHSSHATTPKLQKNIQSMQDSIKRLNDYGREVESSLRPSTTIAFVDERGTQYYEILNSEYHWRDIRDRTSHGVRYLEEQYRQHFPNVLAQKSLTSSHNPKKRKTNDSMDLEEDDLKSIPTSLTQGTRYETYKEIDKIIEGFEAVSQGVFIVSKIMGSSANVVGLKVTCRNTFAAYISFKPKGLSENVFMDKITIYAMHEEKEGIWDKSQYAVFQKLTETARDAMRHYMLNYPESAVRRMIMWLSCYRHLYSSSCKGCGKFLYYDSTVLMFLPPTYRRFDDMHPFHPQCVPKQ